MGGILGPVLACYPFAALSGFISHGKQGAYARAHEKLVSEKSTFDAVFAVFQNGQNPGEVDGGESGLDSVWTPNGLQRGAWAEGRSELLISPGHFSWPLKTE
jgi:hypothetical protein